MIGTLRAIIRLLTFVIACIGLLIFDLVILILFIPFGKKACRRVSTFFGPFWGTLFVKLLGIKITISGLDNVERGQNYCVVSNHLSYLDILIVGSHFPLLFVARHDVKYWPLLGTIAWLRGSIFVNRSITGAKERPYVKEIINYLKSGFEVVIFPEGTSSNGAGVLPFKKTIFSCPVRAGVPILPVTIRYARINGEPFSELNRDLVCWYGGMTFLDHFWNVLRLRKFEVELQIHPPVFEEPQEDWLEQNRKLSAKIHDIVEAGYKDSYNDVNA